MIIKYGLAPTEQESRQFRYQYLDIYKKFFKKVHKGDNSVYVPQRLYNNAKEFLTVKKLNIIRIFIVGGSVGYNFGFYPFENTLRGLIPNKDFEVICCGMGAYDSYRDALIVKEILGYKPDLIVVFSGNNEFYDKFKINLWYYNLNKLLRKSWVYRKLQDWFLKQCAERGMVYFRDTKKRLIDYEKNIRLIVQMAKVKRVPVILCTLPVNFRDCPPIDRPPIDKQYLLSRYLLEKKDYPNAINEFRQFLKSNPNDAFGFYFLAHAYEGIKDYSKARDCYLKSVELDFSSGGRASRQSNDIIRKICTEEKVGFADLESAFVSIAPYGLLGREQFSDNCHWYMEYNSVVAEVIIREIAQNSAMFANIIGSHKDKLRNHLISNNFPSLKECGRRKDEVDGRINSAVWEVLRLGNDGLSERAISYFETVYLMNPDSLWAIRSSKDKIKKMLSEDFGPRNILLILRSIGQKYFIIQERLIVVWDYTKKPSAISMKRFC